MKKLLATLLALALLMALAAAPALASSTLLSWNGLEVTATGYSYKEDGDGYAYIRLDVHIVNHSSHPIWLHPKDVMIDGTPIKAVGISGIKVGASMDDWIMFKPADSNKDGGDGAIRTGSQIDMTLLLDDNDTYDDLYSQDVSINLYDLSVRSGDYTDYSDDIPADFGHGGANNASYAPPYTPASTDYKTLKQGSKGQAVKDLQQRLTDLGYLNDKVDGSFGRNTNTAVRSFCEQNGLPIANEATPDMQRLLYSSSAQYYQEPYIPLVIGATYNLETPMKTGMSNTGFMNIQVVNRSSTRGIRGFVLSYYQTDMYGEKVNLLNPDNAAGRAPIYTFEQEQMNYVEPGHYKDAMTFTIERYYNTYAVYVGVKKIVFDDGEVRELSDSDVVYFECAIQK